MLYGATIMLVLCLTTWIIFGKSTDKEKGLKESEKLHQHQADSLIHYAMDKDKYIDRLRADSEATYHAKEDTQIVIIQHIRNANTKKHDAIGVLSNDSLDFVLSRFLHK
jgi:hypothetical protein